MGTTTGAQDATRPARERLVGVDLARALAVVGMMAVHVLPSTASGVSGWLYAASHGRASALFAVLAGVSLGLLSRRVPATGTARAERAGLRAGVAVRALLITALGLVLVGVQPVIAVILPYYGLAFLVLLPVLWWPGRRLAVLAGAWLVLGPVTGHLLRRGLPAGPGPQPDLTALADPGDLLRELAVTGYYPVIGWAGYLLLGLAVSRTDLRARTGLLRLAAVGALLAGGAALLSGLLLGPAGGAAALARADPQAAAALSAAGGSFYGTTPATSWWWLAVDAAHSGTPLDLLGTAGSALLVLAACLALPAAVVRRLGPLTAAGSMPLSVYTGHVVAVGVLYVQQLWLLVTHVVLACLLAAAWRASAGRGPLEEAVAAAAAAADRAVRRARGPLRPSRPPG